MKKIKDLYDVMFNNIEYYKWAYDENNCLKFREEILRNELTDMKYSEGFYPVITVHYYFKYSSIIPELSIVMNSGEEYIICTGEEIKNVSGLVMGYDEFKETILDCCANMAAEVKCHNYDNEIIELLNDEDTI